MQYDLNLRDYWRILRKRRFTVILATVLLTALSFLFASFQHPVLLYRSSVSVKIEENKTFTGVYLEAISFSTADTLETQTVIIKSYPILEKVAKRLGLIDASLSSEQIRADNELLGKVLQLKDKITTERERNTNIINIYATDSSPEAAQRLAATVAEVYREENTSERNKRVFEARRFIEGQLAITRATLKQSEEKVSQFRESHRMLSLSSEASRLTSNVSKIESLYDEARRANENLKRMLAQLERKAAVPEEELQGLIGESPSPAFSALNSRLTDLTLKRDTLLLDFTEKHPEVVEVSKQIDEVVNGMVKELVAKQNAMALKEKQYLAELEVLRKQYTNLPQEGLTLARLEREVSLNEEIVKQLEGKYQEVLIKEAEKIEEVTIVRPALESPAPINPSRKPATTAIGFVLGIAVGVVFALIRESLDTSIGTIADVEQYLELPVVGIIVHTPSESIFENEPEMKEKFAHMDRELFISILSLLEPESTVAENFRALVANVQYTLSEKKSKTLLITASTQNEGKTSVACNMAIIFAEMNYKTLVIDGDMRKPNIHRVFGLSREPGLSDIILGTNNWKDVRNTITDMMVGNIGLEGVMATHGIDNLHIITSGTSYSNPMRLLTSERLKSLMEEVKAEYDLVIIDSPPILQSSDPVILAERVDGVLLIYKVGSISRGLLKRAKDQLTSVKADCLGVILNQLKAEISPDFQGQRYYYKYYYTYGKRGEKEGRLASLVKSMRGKEPSKISEGLKAKGVGSGLKGLLIIIALATLIAGIYWNR